MTEVVERPSMPPEEDVERLRGRIDKGHPKTKSLPHDLVSEMCELLWKANINPRAEALIRLFRCSYLMVAPGVSAWRRFKGLPEQGIRSDRALPTNIEELANIIAAEIAAAPQTCYDPANDGRWPAPSNKILAYLGRIENESVRNVLALYALIKANNTQFPTYNRITNFASILRLIMTEQGVHDVTTINPNDMLFRVYRGEIGEGLTDYQRGMLISHWNDIRGAFDDYCESLSGGAAF